MRPTSPRSPSCGGAPRSWTWKACASGAPREAAGAYSNAVAIDHVQVSGWSGAGETTIIEISGQLDGVALRATIPPTTVLNGATQIRVDGSRAFIEGTLGRLTYQQVVSLSRNHPEVDTLILLNVPGSVDDEANV